MHIVSNGFPHTTKDGLPQEGTVAIVSAFVAVPPIKARKHFECGNVIQFFRYFVVNADDSREARTTTRPNL